MAHRDSGPQNVSRHPGQVSASERAVRMGHRGCVVWLTGLSGSGKSTVAYALERRLHEQGRFATVLDGDNLRYGLCGDLRFCAEDRRENIRRVGHVAALFADAGLITIVSLISPYRSARLASRAAVGTERFVEVFLDVPPTVCEDRDPKGLWARARSGELKDFTGLDAPYEPPEAAEIVLRTHETTLTDCLTTILDYLGAHGLVHSRQGEPNGSL